MLVMMILVALLQAAAGKPAQVRQAPPVPQTVQPGAPGQPTREIAAKATPPPAASDADVKFMEGMIHHHFQAIQMVELLATRTDRADMQMLGKKIRVSQTDEIGMMQRWLAAHGQTVPDLAMLREHASMVMMMPGMLTPEEMARLAASKGPEFDRRFLEGMIKHHEGAITMVHDLFATPGAAQQSDVFQFASDVEADQLIEIRRMRAMLGSDGGTNA